MKGTTQLTPSDSCPPNVEEQIRCRAYELYEQRGKGGGYDVEDWLLAEAEIHQGEPETQAVS